MQLEDRTYYHIQSYIPPSCSTEFRQKKFHAFGVDIFAITELWNFVHKKKKK